MSRCLVQFCFSGLIVSMAVSLSSCQEEHTDALDIDLVPDLNLNTIDQVLSRIDTVTVVIDSEEGLYERGDEQLGGPVEIRNADSNEDDLEIVASAEVFEDRFPLIRIEQGGLPHLPLDIHAFGWSRDGAPDPEFNAGLAVAEGQVLSISFQEGLSTVTIPFNIRPELLPPRVNDVLPGDGEMLENCTLLDVAVLFSKPMDAASLRVEDAITIEPIGEIREVITDASGLVAHLKIEGATSVDTLTFTLRVSTSVSDLAGMALDQVPTREGSQAFEREATLTCYRGPDNPETPCSPTVLDGDCLLPELFECVDGQCLPRGCEVYDCADSLTCHPETGVCEVDCRLYGELNVCPAERPQCAAETGLCER